MGCKERRHGKACVCPVQGRVGHTEGSEGWSRAKGCLVDLLKGELKVVKISNFLSHLSKYIPSVHFSWLLRSHRTRGIFRRSVPYIQDPTFRYVIITAADRCWPRGAPPSSLPLLGFLPLFSPHPSGTSWQQQDPGRVGEVTTGMGELLFEGGTLFKWEPEEMTPHWGVSHLRDNHH